MNKIELDLSNDIFQVMKPSVRKLFIESIKENKSDFFHVAIKAIVAGIVPKGSVWQSSRIIKERVHYLCVQQEMKEEHGLSLCSNLP